MNLDERVRNITIDLKDLSVNVAKLTKTIIPSKESVTANGNYTTNDVFCLILKAVTAINGRLDTLVDVAEDVSAAIKDILTEEGDDE